jgi:SAM-dependent methyltransferase
MIVDRIHGSYVHKRRVRRLAQLLSERLPRAGRVLDVGCGDGLLASALRGTRGDGALMFEGIDVLVRPDAHIPVTPFDGRHIPFDDASVDAVLFVDVLHHADDPHALLREARRVTRRTVLIKDHTRAGLLAGPTLRFMDRVGNARHGVALPYNYWSRAQWDDALNDAGLDVVSWQPKLGLYPFPASAVFDRSLHFVAELAKRDT